MQKQITAEQELTDTIKQRESKQGKKTTRISVRIPDEHYEKLHNSAKARHTKISCVFSDACSQQLVAFSQEERPQEILDRLQEKMDRIYSSVHPILECHLGTAVKIDGTNITLSNADSIEEVLLLVQV